MSFGAVALTSSLCASLVTMTVTSRRDWWRARTDARIAMIAVIRALEDYAAAADDHLMSIDSVEQALEQIENEGSLEETFESVPSIKTLGTPREWRAAGVLTAIRISNFEIALANAASAARLRTSPYLPDARAKIRAYTATTALEALALASDLKSIWKLEALRSAGVEDLAESFESRRDAYLAERDLIARRTADNP